MIQQAQRYIPRAWDEDDEADYAAAEDKALEGDYRSRCEAVALIADLLDIAIEKT